jgi:hypothetical protein
MVTVPAVTMDMPLTVSNGARNRFHGHAGTVTGHVPNVVTKPVGRRGRRNRLWSRRTRDHVTTVTIPAAATRRQAARAPRDWGRTVRWCFVWAITGVATWMAATGQVEVWAWADLNGHDPRRFGVPFIAEVGVIAWLLIGKHAAGNGGSPYPWWMVAAAFSTLAVYMNTVHGGWKSALIFGGASALSLALWFAEFYLDYVGDEVGEKLRDGARPKVFTLTQPRLSWKAWQIVQRRAQVRTPARAMELAELWLWVYQDTKATLKDEGKLRRPARGRVARRTAWLTVNKECGVKTIIPQGVQVAQVRFAAPQPPPRVAVAPATPHPGGQPVTAASPAPAAPARTSPPARVAAPEEVPAELFTRHATRIAAVQAAHGENWWRGDKPLPVNTIQKVQGCGNRTDASETAACLRHLRARQRSATAPAG